MAKVKCLQGSTKWALHPHQHKHNYPLLLLVMHKFEQKINDYCCCNNNRRINVMTINCVPFSLSSSSSSIQSHNPSNFLLSRIRGNKGVCKYIHNNSSIVTKFTACCGQHHLHFHFKSNHLHQPLHLIIHPSHHYSWKPVRFRVNMHSHHKDFLKKDWFPNT